MHYYIDYDYMSVVVGGMIIAEVSSLIKDGYFYLTFFFLTNDPLLPFTAVKVQLKLDFFLLFTIKFTYCFSLLLFVGYIKVKHVS